MTAELVKFGVVMAVLMVGFTASFHVLFRDFQSFGDTFLHLFKSTLGDTAFFDVFAGGRYDLLATVLLVTYLVVMSVMLLNLLVAILGTAHASVAEDLELEFQVSKASLTTYYRSVVDEDLLPAPFNLAPLLLTPLFKTLGCCCTWSDAFRNAKHTVGLLVFRLVMGPLAANAGAFLWVVSVVHAPFAWQRHYTSQCDSLEKMTFVHVLDARQRALRYGVVCAWCVVGAPLYLYAMLLKALVDVGGLRRMSRDKPTHRRGRAEEVDLRSLFVEEADDPTKHVGTAATEEEESRKVARHAGRGKTPPSPCRRSRWKPGQSSDFRRGGLYERLAALDEHVEHDRQKLDEIFEILGEAG